MLNLVAERDFVKNELSKLLKEHEGKLGDAFDQAKFVEGLYAIDEKHDQLLGVGVNACQYNAVYIHRMELMFNTIIAPLIGFIFKEGIVSQSEYEKILETEKVKFLREI